MLEQLRMPRWLGSAVSASAVVALVGVGLQPAGADVGTVSGIKARAVSAADGSGELLSTEVLPSPTDPFDLVEQGYDVTEVVVRTDRAVTYYGEAGAPVTAKESIASCSYSLQLGTPAERYVKVVVAQARATASVGCTGGPYSWWSRLQKDDGILGDQTLDAVAGEVSPGDSDYDNLRGNCGGDAEYYLEGGFGGYGGNVMYGDRAFISC